MLKAIIGGLIGAIAFANVAVAQTCAGYPYTFSNGTTADATQVNADFNSILSCANTYLAPLANPNFTGNVGIGTPATFKLAVAGAGTGSLLAGDVAGFGGNYTSMSLNGLSGATNYNFLSSPTDSTLYINSPSQIQFRQNNITFMVLGNGTSYFTGTGNFGIGTSSPSYTLHVNGSVAGTSAYNNLSDLRLKKDVSEIDGALNLIERLRGVRFRWREPSERTIGRDLHLPVGDPQIGLIAQEVKGVLPEAVTKSNDGIFSIQESKVVPVLVEAVKAQQAEIESLKATNKIQASENNVLRQQSLEIETRLTRLESAMRQGSPKQAALSRALIRKAKAS